MAEQPSNPPYNPEQAQKAKTKEELQHRPTPKEIKEMAINILGPGFGLSYKEYQQLKRYLEQCKDVDRAW
jgi:hypothetical protein